MIFMMLMMPIPVFMYLVVIKSIEIKIRHQISLNIVYSFSKGLDKLVEIFFVKEDFVTVVTVFIKFFAAFSNR